MAQQVLGLNPYIYWNRLFYAELGGYRTLNPWSLSALGIPPPGTSSIDGLAPSWRLALEPAWGNNTWEVGTFGLAASLDIPFNYGGPALWPWLNMKLGLQYIRYSRFDGASTNYDGAGTNASANNTLFAFAWFAF